MVRHRYFYCAMFLALFPLLANAATQLADLKRIGNPSPTNDAAFGRSVAGVGDLNGDGIGDLVIGAPGADTVYVISGKDQSVIRTVSDPDGLSKYQFGWSVVDVGDWDGDGFDDFAVGAPGIPNAVPLPCVLTPCKPDPQWGRVFVFSGATGAVLKKFNAPEETLQFGYAIAPLGDLTLTASRFWRLVRRSWASDSGCLCSSRNRRNCGLEGKETGAGIGGKQPIASFGASLAVLRDINGDGKPDIVVGAPFHDDGTGKYEGAAYVLSGANGNQLRSHFPPQVVGNNRFGVSVLNVGDQNKGGVDDYLIGDPKISKVHLFNGADGTYLEGIASRQLKDGYGSAAALVSDYDGDGIRDFFVAAPDGDHLYLLNNAGTQLLDVANPAPATHSFGSALSATKDLGGDLGLDLLVGTPAEVSGSGAAYVVTIRANKPPVADAGPDQRIECDRSGVVNLDGSASYDPDNDPITYQWKQVSGTTVTLAVSGAKAQFTAAPPGVYEFQLKVTDDKGASSTDNVVVTIRDTRPPVMTVRFSPDTLWPPNHKMVDISALIQVTDACDPNPTVKLVSIVSNEPANSTGDGNTSPDIAGASYGTDDRSFQLRAERKGNGSGRVYTGTYQAQDAAGNSGQQSGTVMVAHSQAEVSQTSLTFDDVATGSSSPAKTLTISNMDSDPLQISSIEVSGTNGGDFSETDNCVPSVGANSTCSINVVFKPTGSGNRAASLVINGIAANLPQQIALSGNGLAATPDFAVNAVPNSATIKAGQSAAFALTINPQGGFNQALTFACTGAPKGASCVFSPASVTPNGASVATTLKVTTTAHSGHATLIVPNFDWFRLPGGALAAAMIFFFGRRRKNRGSRSVWPMLMFLLVATWLCVACSGGAGTGSASSPVSVDGTPTGTSQITVTTSSGSGSTSLQHTATLSLTVTQ